MDRRTALKGFAATAALACPVCAGLTEVRAQEHGAPHWGYQGEGGPEHWGDLSPDFRACSMGTQQSPINLVQPVASALDPIVVDWTGRLPLDVANNGHTIQVNCPPGSTTTASGRRFELLQFHFHHPSEHLVSGRAFEMEAHFVHRSEDGDLAVLGVFIRPGAQNATLAGVWSVMPQEEGHVIEPATIRPADLLPAGRDYFRYAGSLTTPPCTEIVSWFVYRDAIEASSAQIQAFARLFPGNARPIQDRRRRFLLSSF